MAVVFLYHNYLIITFTPVMVWSIDDYVCLSAHLSQKTHPCRFLLHVSCGRLSPLMTVQVISLLALCCDTGVWTGNVMTLQFISSFSLPLCWHTGVWTGKPQSGDWQERGAAAVAKDRWSIGDGLPAVPHTGQLQRQEQENQTALRISAY